MTNGDATVPGLRGAGVGGTIMAWRDVLHEGPVPDVPEDELRGIRAGFLAGEGGADIGTASEFAERDRTLAALRGGSFVLWFEADLYDQLQLIQILAKLRELGVPAGQITLICIGEHQGIAHFGGLGELSSEQLSRLPGNRRDDDDRLRDGARRPRLDGTARSRPPAAGLDRANALP